MYLQIKEERQSSAEPDDEPELTTVEIYPDVNFFVREANPEADVMEFPHEQLAIRTIPTYNPNYNAGLMTHEESVIHLQLPESAIARIMDAMNSLEAHTQDMSSLEAAHHAYATAMIPGNKL